MSIALLKETILLVDGNFNLVFVNYQTISKNRQKNCIVISDEMQRNWFARKQLKTFSLLCGYRFYLQIIFTSFYWFFPTLNERFLMHELQFSDLHDAKKSSEALRTLISPLDEILPSCSSVLSYNLQCNALFKPFRLLFIMSGVGLITYLLNWIERRSFLWYLRTSEWECKGEREVLW